MGSGDPRISIGERGAGQAVQSGIRLAPPCLNLEGRARPVQLHNDNLGAPAGPISPEPLARGECPLGLRTLGGFPRLPLRMDLGDQRKTAQAPAMTGVAADTITLKSRWAADLCLSALFEQNGLRVASANEPSWSHNHAEPVRHRLPAEALMETIIFPVPAVEEQRAWRDSNPRLSEPESDALSN